LAAERAAEAWFPEPEVARELGPGLVREPVRVQELAQVPVQELAQVQELALAQVQVLGPVQGHR
jgi:hypothetical protein